MEINRRRLLKLVGVAASSASSVANAKQFSDVDTQSAIILPDRESFLIGERCYLDAGAQHPISRGAQRALQGYISRRMLDPLAPAEQYDEMKLREKFARLINADPSDIAFVPSTTAAEQMVLRGLNLPSSGGHIVSDELHFFGSLPLYEEMSRQGVDVTWIKPKDGRIALDDIRRSLRKGTKLVALSLVSTINGFQHDLTAVCELAHSYGALVYADIVHAAGCVPVDVRASGVDFAACSSYKWLMGEFGLGFIYASKAARERLRRTEYGYYGLELFNTHLYTHDTPNKNIIEYAFATTAEGQFAHGTMAHPVMALLDYSLDYINRVGVSRIQAHAQNLSDHLKSELPKLGYVLETPIEARTPLVACSLANARERLNARLKSAGVRITLSRHRFRASFSVFNTHTDVERLLAVLGRNI